MNRDLFDVVAGVLTGRFDVDPERVRPDASIARLGLDSLAPTESVFAVEDRFRTRIPEDRRSRATSAAASPACAHRAWSSTRPTTTSRASPPSS